MPYLGPKPVNVRSASSLIVDGNLTAGQVNSDGAVIATGAGTFGDDVNITGDVDVTGAISGSLTTASLPAGSVLQVVQGTASVQDSTSSESFVATSLSASITPSSASNKILITYTGRHATNTSDIVIYTSIFRDGTEVTGESNGLAQVYIEGQRPFVTTGATFLDSPSTTSSVTYAVCFKKLFSGSAVFGSTGQKAVITLMEIAG